ncbi:MAG: hypothetical protein JWO02_1170 [Solirubrobacterales bacterium]|nr:hypothetical protein [Solirubrobacterales bacterium]
MTRARLIALALCAAALLGVFARGQVSTSDGLEMYRTSVSIVDDRDVWLDEVPRIGVTGRDGHRVSKYGPALPVLGVIPVALVTPVAKVVGHEDQLRQFAWSLLIPAAAVALLLWMVVLGMRLGASFGWAVAAAGGALFCTYALPYTEDSFTEPLVALAVVGAVERVLAGRLQAAGALIGLGMLARPQLAPLGALLVAFAAWDTGGSVRERVRAALPAAAGPAVAVALLALYNLLRFGDVTETGYKLPTDPGFTTPLFKGLHGLFLTSSKSVLLFAPLVLLVPWGVRAVWRYGGRLTADGARPLPGDDPGRRVRIALVLLVANALLTLVTTATWWSWMGGWSWGPRLLLPGVIPLLVVLGPWLTALSQRDVNLMATWPGRAFAAACIAGFAVSASTLLVSPQAQLLDRPVPKPGPSITRQYAMVPSRVSRLRDPADPVDGGDQKKLVPVWQVALARESGTKAYAIGVLGTLLLLGVGGVGVRRLRRDLRRTGMICTDET